MTRQPNPHQLSRNAKKKTNVVIRCILTSDVTEPENYGLSENQTPDLCHSRHNTKTTKNDRKL